MGVAATFPRRISRSDASAGVSPSGRVSISSDQPPCGRSHGYPSSCWRIVRARASSTSVNARTSASASGADSAAATACWAMPTWHTTLAIPTSATSDITSAGPTTQPTRQPIMRSSLDAEPTVIVRSRRVSTAAGPPSTGPPNRRRSIAVSWMIHGRWPPVPSASAVQCAVPMTPPVGMLGDIVRTAAVSGPTAAASWSGSTCQPSAVARAGTNRGTPPTNRTRLTSPA